MIAVHDGVIDYDWGAKEMLYRAKLVSDGVSIELVLGVAQAVSLREGLDAFLASAAKVRPGGRQEAVE